MLSFVLTFLINGTDWKVRKVYFLHCCFKIILNPAWIPALAQPACTALRVGTFYAVPTSEAFPGYWPPFLLILEPIRLWYFYLPVPWTPVQDCPPPTSAIHLPQSFSKLQSSQLSLSIHSILSTLTLKASDKSLPIHNLLVLSRLTITHHHPACTQSCLICF